MDSAMKALSAPLSAYVKGFPPPGRLHPFERALLDLTVGEDRYATVLARVDALRRKLTEVHSLHHRLKGCIVAINTQRYPWASEATRQCWRAKLMEGGIP